MGTLSRIIKFVVELKVQVARLRSCKKERMGLDATDVGS